MGISTTGGGGGVVGASDKVLSYGGVSGLDSEMIPQILPQGRLTLTTAVPVTTADVTAAGTLYYTPYTGDICPIYNGTNWTLVEFTEISLALTLTDDKNYDVFAYDNSGTLTLELSAAWTNDTTRADALARQNGTLIKSGTATRTWLGTIRASGTDTTEDSTTKRFVVNGYNALSRRLYANPGYSNDTFATTYTSNSTTWTAANAGTGSKVEFISREGGYVNLLVTGGYNGNVNGTLIGIGIDSSTDAAMGTISDVGTSALAALQRQLSEGYHTADLIIRVGAGTSTYYADFLRGGSAADVPVTVMEGFILG